MKVSIVIPAHNEDQRIGRTLKAYAEFFEQIKEQKNIEVELIVVLNACSDDTRGVVREMQALYPSIIMLDFPQPGKGFAIIQGFKDALARSNDLIGFVDADMATSPVAFYDLIQQIDGHDGIIASRYMPGARITPPRPFIKRWGSKIFYETLVWLLFGMRFYDYQCGAKLFKRCVIETVVPELIIQKWAFDIDLLYACKRHKFTVIEVPTVWNDQAGSKLRMMRAGMRMLSALFYLRLYHSPFKKWLGASSH